MWKIHILELEYASTSSSTKRKVVQAMEAVLVAVQNVTMTCSGRTSNAKRKG